MRGTGTFQDYIDARNAQNQTPFKTYGPPPPMPYGEKYGEQQEKAARAGIPTPTQPKGIYAQTWGEPSGKLAAPRAPGSSPYDHAMLPVFLKDNKPDVTDPYGSKVGETRPG